MRQLELFEKVKQIKIVFYRGHKILFLEVCDVKQFLINQPKESGLCLFVDGVQLNPVAANANIISAAKEIILTRSLESITQPYNCHAELVSASKRL
jgi:hypothetical protein